MRLPAPNERDIRRIVDLVVAEVAPLRVVLFGSGARGELRDGSDVDLMVVMPEGSDRIAIQQRLCAMPRAGVRAAIDFVVTTPDDYERYKDRVGMVYRQVAREGRELYAA